MHIEGFLFAVDWNLGLRFHHLTRHPALRLKLFSLVLRGKVKSYLQTCNLHRYLHLFTFRSNLAVKNVKKSNLTKGPARSVCSSLWYVTMPMTATLDCLSKVKHRTLAVTVNANSG